MNATTYYYNKNGTLVSQLIFDETFEKLTKVFAQVLRFSYQLLPPTDGEIGIRLPNGNWTGVVGMLQRNEADLAITSLFLSLERAEVVDFSYPYTLSKFSFSTRKPEYHPKFTTILNPFSFDVWFAVAVSLSVIPFFLFAVFERRYSLKLLFWCTFSSFIIQNIRLQPKKIVEYIILAFWLVSATFLIYSYMAVFLAFLTFPPLSGVRTVSELASAVSKGEYKCVTYHGTFIGTALAKCSDSNLRIIGRSLLENKGINNMDIILNEKKSFKKSAFIGIETHLIIWKEIYFYSDDVIFPMLMAVAMRKKFCCKTHLDRVIIRLWESGIYKKIVNERIYHHTVSQIANKNQISVQNDKEKPITLEHLKGAFLFLTIGYFLSFLAFIFEVCAEKIYEIRSKLLS